jgi:tetratricopeptide (TPR) repeat protein
VVGREAELAQLHGWLEKALRGERQILFVTGEPGIGKTTLSDAFLEQVAADPSIWTARGQCVAHYGTGEAYLPLLEALAQLGHRPANERFIALLRHYAPMWLLQMPSLIDLAERKKLQRETQGITREQMLREIAEALETLTQDTPLVLILEDLHWSDSATLDFIAFLAHRQAPARLLLIGTYRPVEVNVSGHLLKAVKQELQTHGQCEELSLGFLSEAAVATYLTTRFAVEADRSAALQPLARLVHQRTDGNPLFVVNVVNDLVAQKLIPQAEGWGQFTGDWETLKNRVPDSLQQMIEKQIERLSPEEQRVLEVASVAGVKFSAAAVAAGLGAEIIAVEELCEGLARRQQFLQAQGFSEWPDGTVAASYEFIHTLYQNVLYERITAGKRVQFHHRIGERREQVYGGQASEIAVELALHFEHGRDYRRAVQYRHRAAKNAIRLCAYHEAMAHLTKGLELLKTLPDTPERLQQEISLQISLGLSLVATKGYAFPEVEKSYTRAIDLCRQIEATPQQYWALWGLQGFYYVRAELRRARTLGEQLFELARRLEDAGLLGVAHFVLGSTLFSGGELVPAREHLEQALELCTAQSHARVRALCLSFTGRVLWALGYPDQALQRSLAARALARELAHPLVSTVTSCIAALLRIVRGEVREAQERAEETMQLAIERGFTHWAAQAMALRGWALAQQGQAEEGLAQIQEGMAAYQETGAQLARPMLLGLLAETYRKMGRLKEGLEVTEEALASARATEERMQEIWLLWLKGELTLQQQSKVQSPKSKVSSTPHPESPTSVEAEGYFLEAIAIARRQEARLMELRATVSLSRLWRQQGKKADARRMLAEIYGWFTEGFDTEYLREARALLEELSR